MPAPDYRFAEFELRPAQRLLLQRGQPVSLGGRAFDLLLVLAERQGQLVTKDELLERVWRGRLVDENNIAVHVGTLRRVLGEALITTVSGHGYCLSAPAAVVAAPAAPAAVNPAPAARLVGRETELAQLQAALRQPGCITLVGPGGVGKSSLAQALLAEWRQSARAAAFWVDLVAVSDPAQLPATLARSCGADADAADPPQAVLRQLGGSPVLLVLDNAEHLVDALAPLALRLLAGATGLRLLVTSQLPLMLREERVLRIEPLALPAPDDTDAQAMDRAAVALFVARLKALAPAYPLAPETWPLLRALCVRLDGLPLALEMAAARVPLLGLQAVHEALGERFAMLRQAPRDTPGRHRSLQAALDWSHGLLSADEQRLFRALGVFAGSFGTGLALAVDGGPEQGHWEAVERLAALVQRSLVASEAAEPPRHRLLETTRAYALAQLAAHGEEAAVRARQLAALGALFAQAVKAPIDSSTRARALDEMPHVREAVAWGLQHAAAGAVQLAMDCSVVAVFSPWRHEAAELLAGCEAALEGIDDRALHANWWRQFATQMLFRGSPRAGPAARRAIELCREVGNRVGLFWALIAALRAGPDEGAATDAWAAEVLALVDTLDAQVPNGRAVALGTLAVLSEQRGDFETALLHRRAELQAARDKGVHSAAAVAQTNLARMLIRVGRPAEALDQLQAYLDGEADAGSPNLAYAHLFRVECWLQLGQAQRALAEAGVALATCRQHRLPEVAVLVARLAWSLNHPRSAAQLLGHAHRLYADRGLPMPAPTAEWPDFGGPLRERLGTDRFEALLARGRRLGPDEADALLFARDDAA